MPGTITDVSTFTDPVPTPADGDEANAAAFTPTNQALGNRTRWLKDNKPTKPASTLDNELPRFDGTDGKTLQQSGVKIDDTSTIVYATPKVRSIIIPACAFVPENSTIVTGLATDGSYRNCGTDSAHFLADLSKYLNDRCTITAYGVQVHPGAARAGGNKMTIKLYRNPFPSSAVQLGSGDSDDGTANAQLLDETLGAPHAVDREANGYTFDVKCGNTSASFADSILYGFITVSEAGPGLGG